MEYKTTEAKRRASKEYQSKHPEKQRRYNKTNYKKNREKLLAKKKQRMKDINYSYDKTGKRKVKQLIRSKSRYLFRFILNCQNCGSNKSLQIHHYTIPYEISKGIKICENCHNLIHARQSCNREEIKHVSKTS